MEQIKNDIMNLQEYELSLVYDYIKSYNLSSKDVKNVACALKMLNKPGNTYKLVRKLGQGQMSSVYIVSHTDKKGTKDLALKIIDPYHEMRERAGVALDTDGKLGQIAGKLGIGPKVYDYGKCNILSEPPSEFVLMEAIKGRNLEQIKIERAIQLLPKVLDAFYDLLKGGVNQRDLSPENVIITKDDKVYIIDYGVAVEYDYKSYMQKQDYNPWAAPELQNRKKTPLETTLGNAANLVAGITIDNDIRNPKEVWNTLNIKTRNKLFRDAYEAALNWAYQKYDSNNEYKKIGITKYDLILDVPYRPFPLICEFSPLRDTFTEEIMYDTSTNRKKYTDCGKTLDRDMYDWLYNHGLIDKFVY